MKRSKKKINKIFIILPVVIILAVVTTAIVSRYKNNVVKKATEISKYYQMGQYFLGFNKQLKVLVLFQNNAEVRHGGGFIGTVGFLEVKDGQIKPSPIRSVYYYDFPADDPNYYTETRQGLGGQPQVLSYTLRDSGANVSWPLNAQRARKIFFKESGQTADVVVAVSPELLKSLLSYTGPIYLKDYDKQVNSNNLLETIQYEVESGVDKQNRRDPKSVLTSVANQLVDKLSSKNTLELLSLYASFKELFQQRHIVVYSSNANIQNFLKEDRLSGELVNFSGDYLQLSEKSLSGTKTGPFIERSIDRLTRINEDGKTQISLNIGRRHLAKENLFRYFDPHFNGYKYLVGYDEIEGKIALPKNSKIIQSSPELALTDREGYYDIYTYQIRTDLGSESDLRLQYESPYVNYMGPIMHYSSYFQLPVAPHSFKLKDCILAPAIYRLQSSSVLMSAGTAKGEICYDSIVKEDLKLDVNYARK